MKHIYEVRYRSEMLSTLALYSRHTSIDEARESAAAFRAHVAKTEMSSASKAYLYKSIEVETVAV